MEEEDAKPPALSTQEMQDMEMAVSVDKKERAVERLKSVLAMAEATNVPALARLPINEGSGQYIQDGGRSRAANLGRIGDRLAAHQASLPTPRPPNIPTFESLLEGQGPSKRRSSQ